MNNVKYYRCNVCGNLVEKIADGPGTMVCCNEEMELLIANTVDAAVEKHIPVVTVENGTITVVVGEVEHPMLPEHHIGWISMITDDGIYRKDLVAGDAPKANFKTDAKLLDVYAWCNLHGLWKANL